MLPDLPQITTRMTLRLGQSQQEKHQKSLPGASVNNVFLPASLENPPKFGKEQKKNIYKTHHWEGFPALS